MEDSAREVTFSAVCFGVCRNSTGTVDTDKLFTGQRLDDTGLYYYNARYYDSTIGRFISADTIVPNPANPQSLNRYSYCLNNPLKYTDPSGHLNPEDYPASEGWEPVYDNGGNVWGYTRGDLRDLEIYATGSLIFADASLPYGGGFNRAYFYASLTGPQESYLDPFQEFLGWIGIVYDPADILNGIIYAARGDWSNAKWSAFYLIPVVGGIAKVGKIAKWWGKGDNALDAAKKVGMLGEGGTQVMSKSLWYGRRGARLDVENPAPGVRPGQIHYHPTQDADGILYDPYTNSFPNAPLSVNELLNDPSFNAAIEKGMKYLGE